MKNILVTGGAGFIGSNFIRILLEKEEAINVVNLDVLTYAGNIQNLATVSDLEQYNFVRGDICDRPLVDSVLEQNEIDTIVHFAAETHVDRSIMSPELFVRSNIQGTFTLLDAANRYWSANNLLDSDQVRFHHISTDEVYGSLELNDPPFTEESPYVPTSPYAASKASSDHLVRAYQQTYGLPVTITNCSNNYGPYQYPEKLIPYMILNCLEGLALPIYGDGRQKRDWLYVGDHCEAIRLVLSDGEVGETYNVAGGTDITNLELVNMLCNILDDALPSSSHAPHAKLITHVEDRPGHDFRYALDISKIEQKLGWSPKHSTETGLKNTVDWYLANPDWIAEVRRQPSYQQWVQENYERRGVKS